MQDVGHIHIAICCNDRDVIIFANAIYHSQAFDIIESSPPDQESNSLLFDILCTIFDGITNADKEIINIGKVSYPASYDKILIRS